MWKSLIVGTCAAALAGCASRLSTQLPPRGGDRAAAVQPADSTPQRNVTHFGDALRCMDNLYLAYGTRDVSVLLEDLTDATKKVSAGTRDMMMSAISDMTRRSRAIQVISFGPDANNIVAFLASAQQKSPFKVVPQFNLRGSITQLDESVLRRQADAGIGLGSVASAGGSRSRQVNVLGLDVAIVTTADLALVNGATSKNFTTLVKEGDGLDSQATIRKVGINFSTSFQRTDGTAQALRNMVELASIELFGRLLKLPYWSCIGVGPDNPEVKAEIEDWFVGMERAGELTPFFQLQLRNRGFYDGPVDGRISPALRRAVAAYRQGLGLGSQAVVDLDLFTRFISAPFPQPPAQAHADLPPPPAPAPATTPAPAAPPVAAGSIPRMVLRLDPVRPLYREGESFAFRVSASTPGYVYCYGKDADNPIQRVFPNRYTPDPRIEPGKPLELPGGQRFAFTASGKLQIACLAAPREVYNDVPPALRWGDFQALNAVRGMDELRRILEAVAKEPVAMVQLTVPLATAAAPAAPRH